MFLRGGNLLPPSLFYTVYVAKPANFERLPDGSGKHAEGFVRLACGGFGNGQPEQKQKGIQILNAPPLF